MLDAIRETWASIWLFRTFEERSWYKVDHGQWCCADRKSVRSIRLEPGFYVNVQYGGEYEVVHPPPGVSSDELIYSYFMTDHPITYIVRSNVLPPGQATVLTASQLYGLGMALDTIHNRFSEAHGPAAGKSGWYAMDVELKLDGDSPETAHIQIKRARPHPGRGE